MSDSTYKQLVEKEIQRKIIGLMRANPKISERYIGDELNITNQGVKKGIAAIRAAGIVERIGPANGGYWLVKEEQGEK